VNGSWSDIYKPMVGRVYGTSKLHKERE
jgi:hypothetical protein